MPQSPQATWMAIVVCLLVGCSGCQSPVTPEPHDPLTEWPKPPQRIALARNWVLGHGWAGYEQIAIAGSVATFQGSLAEAGWAGAFDLASGQVKWVSDLYSEGFAPFSDGESFYRWSYISLQEPQNTLRKFSPAGERTLVRIDAPGSSSYDDPVLDNIEPSLSWYHRQTAFGTSMYWDSEFPGVYTKPEGHTLPGGQGGLFAIDLSKAVPTEVPGQTVVTARLVFPRTEARTIFDSRMAVFEQDGQRYLVFAQVFNVDHQNDGYREDGSFDEALVSQYCKVRCVNEATGEVLWTFSDPYLFRHVNLVVEGDSIYVTGLYSAHRLNRLTGVPVWTHPYQSPIEQVVGGQGMDAVAFADGVMYVNKTATNFSTGLEAVDWATGKRLWARPQPASQGHAIAVKNGIVYAFNQQAARLYRASDGKYLAADESVKAEEGGAGPNASFWWTNPADGARHFILFGDKTFYSLPLNAKLDLFGNLVKE